MLVRLRLALLALVPTFLALSLVSVSPARAAVEPTIFGYVTDSSGRAASTMTVRLFRSDADDQNWSYLRQVNVKSSGIYEIPTDGPGRYHLQLVERRPAYDLSSYARVPNVNLNVGTTNVVKDVKVRKGGAIGGSVKVRVKVHGKAKWRKAARARLRAISDDGQVYEVTADGSGRYALGGLPGNNYRVFAYDSAYRRVGPSKLVRNVSLGSYRAASFGLRTSPSAYRGFLFTGNRLAEGDVTVTLRNTRTGEYWVQEISDGALSLRGLTAGGYTLTVPDTHGYFGRTVTLPSLKTGQTRTASVTLPTKGGTFTGTVVDATSGAPIPNVSVRLTDSAGKVQSEITASSTGTFSIGGQLRAQAGVSVTILAYDKIGEHYYESRTFSGLGVADDVALDLNQISTDTLPNGTKVIKLQRKPVVTPAAP